MTNNELFQQYLDYVQQHQIELTKLSSAIAYDYECYVELRYDALQQAIYCDTEDDCFSTLDVTSSQFWDMVTDAIDQNQQRLQSRQLVSKKVINYE